MDALVISAYGTSDEAVEIVERKGLGHPDTICDALAETFSRNLSREYRRRYGTILHHNVDKALLVGGRATAVFGGGTVRAPIGIYLAGRATITAGGEKLPVTDLAVEGSLAWLRQNMHALDAERHVQIQTLIQPGSADLQAIFARKADAALANDTSIGVGYSPMTPLERLVLAVEKRINGRRRDREHPAWGEDVKVMGVRHGKNLRLNIACAMIGRHLGNLDDYLGAKAELEKLARELSSQHGFEDIDIAINAADDASTGSVYLTVTGTSAEAGDDGQVGRGNRVNGLITPMRPMSLEAAAGKNPVSHVGKIYNVVARNIAQRITADLPEIEAAQCFLASRIGAPVTSPSIVHLRLKAPDAAPIGRFRAAAAEIAADQLARIPTLVDDFIEGAVELF